MDKLDGYLDEIYAAILDPAQGWTRLCDVLADASGGVGAAIVPWRQESRFAHFPISNSIIPLVSEYQTEKWYLRDTRDAGIPLFRSQNVFTEQDFMTPDQMAWDPMYQELLAKHKVMHGAVVRMATSEGLYCASIQRETRRGNFDAADLAMLTALSPHLARAASFSFRLGMEHARGTIAAFEKLGMAACALDRNGKVLALNTPASAQVGQWYDIAGGHLSAKVIKDNVALQQIIARVISPHGRKGANGVLDAIIRHPVSGQPLLVQACPLGPDAHSFFSGLAALLLFVDDSSRAGSFEALMQNYYGLTSAEVRVAELLADGHDVLRIADLLENSRHTIRAHIRSIYQKTDDGSRSTLVKRMVSLRQKLILRP